MSPEQAAYDAYQIKANRAQSTMDKLEAELREPVTAERRDLLDKLQAESVLAQLKMADFNATR